LLLKMGGTMRFNLKKVRLLATWIILAEGRAYPQHAVDELQALVATSAQRLAIADQVALAKWDNGMPVEDAPREDHVIVSATKAGQSRGLDPRSVANFFRAQIEANKLVQYSLLAEWRRVGKAPDHPSVDLASTIRPALDEVDKALIAELEETTTIRASAACRTDVAKAVGKYVSAHKDSVGPLTVIALDRVLATACISPLRQ
jgi:chorismate mutase